MHVFKYKHTPASSMERMWRGEDKALTKVIKTNI